MPNTKKWKLFFILFNIIGGGLALGCYIMKDKLIRTEDCFFLASQPSNWSVIDPTIQLHGKWYIPNTSPEDTVPIVIMFHGITRTLADHDYFARKLAANGFICFAIDFHGHGQSNGTFPMDDGAKYNMTFGDALGAYRYIMEQRPRGPEDLLGYGISLGGGAAIFLALSGLVPQFLAWYPALAYMLGNTPMYQYNSSHPLFRGLILAGTEDECTRCAAEYVNQFVANNPTVQVHWLEGAKHTDSRFYQETIDMSLEWLPSLWKLPRFTWMVEWIGTGIMTWLLLGLVGQVDLIGIARAIYLKRHSKTNVN